MPLCAVISLLTNHRLSCGDALLKNKTGEKFSISFLMEKGIECCMKTIRPGFLQIYDSSRWDFSIHLTKTFQQAELSVIVHIS